MEPILKWKTYLKEGGGRGDGDGGGVGWDGEGVDWEWQKMLGWTEKILMFQRIKFET